VFGLDDAARRRRAESDQFFAHRLGWLLQVGVQAILDLDRSSKPVTFAAWRESMFQAVYALHPKPDPPTGLPAPKRPDRDMPDIQPYHLIWLWEALRRESFLQAHIQVEATAPIDVLPAGSHFRFELRNEMQGDATALILQTLQMRDGKGGRLECESVATELTLPLSGASTDNPELEALALNVAPERVRLCNGQLVVQADSLNQAYTLASMRFEPARRSHTGRIYDKVFWLVPSRLVAAWLPKPSDKQRSVKLWQLREAVERGDWPLPGPDSSPPQAHQYTEDVDGFGRVGPTCETQLNDWIQRRGEYANSTRLAIEASMLGKLKLWHRPVDEMISFLPDRVAAFLRREPMFDDVG
jgi:hypothetical protein